MKRKSLSEDSCPVARSLDIIGDWWTLLIIRDALAGVTRFNDFGRSLGAAKSSLSTRLKALVEQQILEVRPASDGSAYQEYALTTKGRALAPVLIGLEQWGVSYAFDAMDGTNAFVDKKNKQPLVPLEMKSSDGRVLQDDEIEWLSGLS